MSFIRSLGSSAQAVYRLILTDHQLDAAGLARRLDLSETEVHAALDELCVLRLLRRSEEIPGEAPGSLRPVDPRVGLPTLLQHNEAFLERSRREFEQNQEAIARMLAEFTEPRTAGDSYRTEYLTGVVTVQARLEELSLGCAVECRTLNPGGAQSAASLEASKPLDRQLLERGVAMKTIYLDSLRNDRTTTDYADWLTNLGGEVRTAPSLPLRMLIFDGETALVPIDPAHTRAGAVQITGPGVLAALMALFDRIWVDATPISNPTERDDHGLSAQERELLRLLSQGLTDEAAGKSLGLSLRTVRRMMADLMERLGAHSRFEAGLHAGRRGWL
ncbi:helix-turn-helix domain-containing protein [Streptacidiphilus rugosus]|uniref:helix-turn-helix domain-containing protein n=1 Tax=Streptacidiphilus rugosus TaxID=405783 RepID=UPI00055E6F8C|nr:helix-turn-helix transcriptional regulator [Streptacidiphilus rugosus]